MLPPGLERLNSLSDGDAEGEFLKCCGSKGWARQMVAQRPFASVAELIQTADRTWWTLTPHDWLEAFRSHPKIGEQRPAQQTSAAALSWSSTEQSGVSRATEDTMQLLGELNRRYEEKFGFIYIVCATGRSSDELLAILRERLPNESDTERSIAAGEQARITQLRLNKLIEGLESGSKKQ